MDSFSPVKWHLKETLPRIFLRLARNKLHQAVFRSKRCTRLVQEDVNWVAVTDSEGKTQFCVMPWWQRVAYMWSYLFFPVESRYSWFLFLWVHVMFYFLVNFYLMEMSLMSRKKLYKLTNFNIQDLFTTNRTCNLTTQLLITFSTVNFTRLN